MSGAVARLALGLLVARRGQLDVLLAEQRGLLDRGDRVGGQLDVAVDGDGHHAPSSRLVELDLLHPADRDVGDADAGLRHEVEHVEELAPARCRGRHRRRRRRAG